MDLKDQKISPIYGSFEKFPNTTLFIAGRDIMYPDSILAIKKMKKGGVNLEVIEETNMMHIWPLLPFMKESKIALTRIINVLNQLLVK